MNERCIHLSSRGDLLLGTVLTWVFFLQKALAMRAPRDFYTLVMSQVSCKERTKTTMPKTGLLMLDYQDLQNKFICSFSTHKRRDFPRKYSCCYYLKSPFNLFIF
jgi:hypothetical protein